MDEKITCCVCGKEAVGWSREVIEIEPDLETMFRKFIPGLITGWCEDHKPKNSND